MAERATRWKDSGLTAAEFGTEIGINPHWLNVVEVAACIHVAVATISHA